MVTKKQFLSLFVAFFATFFSVFGQKIAKTLNGVDFIIDDRVIGLTIISNCNPSNFLTPQQIIPPTSNHHRIELYTISITAPKIADKLRIYYDHNNLWHIGGNQNYDDTYHAFIYDKELLYPEISQSNELTFTSTSGLSVDIDSKILYDCSRIQKGFDISPNPTSGTSDVIIDLDYPEVAKIIIYDNFGNILQTSPNINLNVGRNVQQIDLSNEQPGLYYIRLDINGVTQSKTIQKI